ncbi:ABC transporter domain-containing protein [Ditylenchus destructor]|uniref:ABC transporter domain-containing protein n=1 Tax=Ditylenchus destructor TaxID=166010 RepID=A0AAD4R8E9_9BILA|nr:ABC transporter domain-containing protein [Ditylenchus destructor]
MKIKLDENSGSMLMFHCAMRWQAVWLDLLVVAVTFIVSILIVCLTGSVSPANAGMAIAFAMQMSGIFQFAVRSQTELEAKLTSVERVLYYCKNIQQEQSTADTDDLPAVWPSTGTISFKHVVLQYPSEPLPALRDVSFDVDDHEKVGIIGRTGSGKSSLCNALFQLYDLKSGTIYLDSRDISKISLSRVRRSMAIIPQDPVLFSGPVRFNIDPEGEYSDDQIWKCLDDVGLREIMTTNFAGKLDFIIEEGGRNLSSGQRQIVCVTRALLRNVKIVVLDEATANMDGRTDEHLQSTIRKAFAEKATVLLITHRLNNGEYPQCRRNSQQKLEDDT